MINILILGSGGRENVLANAYSKNKKVRKIFLAPGNAYIDYQNKKATSFTEILSTDFDGVLKLIKKHHIDLVDVAQDDPLAEGFVDRLEKLGVKTFGPTKNASEIEWSKDWARSFMIKYKMPIPKYKSFNKTSDAISYVNKSPEKIVYVKASGLALGKGAIRAENKKEAISAINQMKDFKDAGKTFLIEEALVGEEFSAFAICDGNNFKILGFAQDHKTVFNQDTGPNTGGMGAVLTPVVITPKVIREVEDKIFTPFIQGMKKEGRPYAGIIFLGGMVTDKGVKIIEFNARWGDPEAEVVIPSIITDYLSIVESAIKGNLSKIKIKRDNIYRVSISACSYGYPIDYSRVKGKIIGGIKNAERIKGVSLYGAGISRKGNNFIVSGGRVLHIVGSGKTFLEAREKAYGAISQIQIEGNNLHYRTDIGYRDLERNSKYLQS